MNLPQRRSIRLPDWDYRTPAYYFITICTYKRQCFFDDPRLHEIAANTWSYIPHQPHAQHVELDATVIMPNHTHGIIRLLGDPATAVAQTNQPHRPPPGSIGAIVGNYKMLVTKRVIATLKASGSDIKVWQRGYWERIIRNARELHATRIYIQENPVRWLEDQDNLNKLLQKMDRING